MISKHPPTSRKVVTLLMILMLCWTTFACGGPPTTQRSQQPAQNQGQQTTNVAAQTKLAAGQYPVQQVTYNDADGEYSLFLLNTPPGTPSMFRTTDLQMAALTEAEASSGQKPYLKVEGEQASLHIPQDFKIEYVHNVVENETNPQTGQTQPVVVGQQSSFWTPFAGALAGQVVGNLLFRPQYYVPPVYRPGAPLTGFGGHGSNYNQAVQRYQTRYQTQPLAVRNRQTRLRSTGRLRSPASSTVRRNPGSSFGNRSTGSGFGSSNLRRSDRSGSSQFRRGSGSFGSGRSTGSRRSFGSGRRR